MTITMTGTAAAARMRALSTVSPLSQAADWHAPIHNSITAPVPNVTGTAARPAGVVGFGAAKQAAPPRGVPR